MSSRWVNGVNIAGDIYINDSKNERMYWADDEDISMITAQLNYYEERVQQLESYCQSLKEDDVPTTASMIIDRITWELKENYNTYFKELREGLQYNVEINLNGLKYNCSFRMELK